MRCQIILLAVLLTCASARSCDCAQYVPRGPDHLNETLGWMNGLVESVLDLNKKYLFDQLFNVFQNQVQDNLPGIIKSVDLEHFELTETPKIEHVTSYVVTVECDDVTFKRHTIDMDFAVKNPGLLMTARVQLPLGIHPAVRVSDVDISGILRLEFLMRSDITLPSIQNLKITFLSRPSVYFNVELIGMDLDTFGIGSMIHNIVEDAIQENLVYPGMVYLDLADLNAGVKTTMIKKDPLLHPAVVSVNVTLTPANATQPKTSIEAWVDCGEDCTRKTVLGNEGSHQFDLFLDDFSSPDTRVRVIDRKTLSSDVNWLDMEHNVLDQIRRGALKETTHKTHAEGSSAWNITVDFWTFLLPDIELVSDNTTSSLQLVPSLFSQTNCTASPESGEHGVFSFFLHHAQNLTAEDDLDDIYAIIKFDGATVITTETAASSGDSPRFDVKFEKLLRGVEITEHTVEIEIWDWDRWSGDDLIGAAKFSVSKSIQINEATPIYIDDSPHGALFISTVFRPVPFL